MIASAARYVRPQPFPEYLALDAFATRAAAQPDVPPSAAAVRRCVAGSRRPRGRRRRRRRRRGRGCSCSPAARGRCRACSRRRRLARRPVPYDGRSPAQLRRARAAGARAVPRARARASSKRARDGRGRPAPRRSTRSSARRSRPARARGARRRAARRRGVLPRVERVRGDDPHERPARAELARRRRSAPSAGRYPATSEPVPVAGNAPIEQAGLDGSRRSPCWTPAIDAKALSGHADPGYDAVDRDRDPKPGTDPSSGARRRAGPRWRASSPRRGSACCRSGSPRCGAAGGAARPSATTDEIIAGLEHAVDPNGDQDTSDHVPVALDRRQRALRGLQPTRPRPGRRRARRASARSWSRPPATRARRRRAAARSARPRARPSALAVGALAGPEPAPRTELEADGDTLAQAAVLAGKPPAAGKTAGPVQDTDPAVARRARRRRSAARS